MPKLPVHLRLYFKQFLFNSRLKEMLRSGASLLTELRTVLDLHNVSGIRVEMPTRMQRPMHRAERSPAAWTLAHTAIRIYSSGCVAMPSMRSSLRWT